MKQIINGKTYNTETAEEIATASASVSRSDFSWWEETLYRTKAGSCFLYGRGGPMSKYSRSFNDGSRTGGDQMVALTHAEAIEWAERRQINPDKLPDDLRPEEA